MVTKQNGENNKCRLEHGVCRTENQCLVIISTDQICTWLSDTSINRSSRNSVQGRNLYIHPTPYLFSIALLLYFFLCWLRLGLFKYLSRFITKTGKFDYIVITSCLFIKLGKIDPVIKKGEKKTIYM